MNKGFSKNTSKLNKERVDGVILEALPGASFKVRLEDGSEILAYLSGNIKRFRIKILPGDKVTVEMSPYDKTRGRIVYRKR